MVQPGSGSGKVPITIGSVQFSFFEGKQALYMKPRSAASARRAISALFVANGFSVYGRRTFRCSSRTISSAMRSGSSEKPGRGVGAAIAAAASVGYLGFLVGPPVVGSVSGVLGLRMALALVVVAEWLSSLPRAQ
jgi:hypothetical protein